jgi:hypothetical protein
MSSVAATGHGERRLEAAGDVLEDRDGFEDLAGFVLTAGIVEELVDGSLAIHKYFYLHSASIIRMDEVMQTAIAPVPETKLAPPGAGLPPVERFVGGILFRLRMLTATRESSNAHFQRERAAIRALTEPLDAATASRRVLIPRPMGLEDSSRFWSVWMVLDHLRMVNTGMARTIGMLAHGNMPPGVAHTAKVKPDPLVTAAIVEPYEESCDALLATVAAAPDLKTSVHFLHPWFGPLDAAAWHAMAGIHMGLHRGQIEQILRLGRG